MTDNSKAFHAHLDVCSQCREHPFNLCATGARLIQAAANSLGSAFVYKSVNLPSRSPDNRAPSEAERADDDGYCLDCGEEFHYDDTGGYNPPCVCGQHCRSCHAAEERESDEWRDGYPDDVEPESSHVR